VTLMTPQQLYELWERQHWQSHTIDLSQDRRDWAAMDGALREQMLWNLSSFFVGEERVTTQFSGLVMAYESQGEEAFLTTQQVDEARHAQHFNRFYEQVIGIDGSFEDRLRQAR
jgi:ribonucleoside-diphosphate reductase beta chain